LPAAVVLFAAIHRGLLGRPEMQISGNGSTASNLQWFVDRSGHSLAQPWALSVPLWIYRVVMLLWALWLAWAMIGWLRWAWEAYREGGLWKRKSNIVKTTPQG